MLALLLLLLPLRSSARTRARLSQGWLFALGDSGYAPCADVNTSFPLDANGLECQGMTYVGNVASPGACADLCCSSVTCQLYNYCAGPGGCASDHGAPGDCWVGAFEGQSCANGTKWEGRARTKALPPSPLPGGPQDPAFNDSAWRSVSLPHDSQVEGTYVNDSSLEGGGYLRSNTSWYRLHLTPLDVPGAWQGQTVWLTFDGIYRACDIFLNGVWLGHHESGFTSFNLYLHNASDAQGRPALVYGGANVLAVHVDGRITEGWWYMGNGIYRSVWLTAAAPLFLVPWGTYAPAFISGAITPASSQPGSGPTAASAAIHLTADLGWAPSASQTVMLRATLLNAAGAAVGAAHAALTLNASASSSWARLKLLLPVPGPGVQLWSLERPYLHTLQCELLVEGAVVDAENTTLGLRRTHFDSRAGFLLNDVPTPIRGACNHQDFAGCGVAVPERANAFRVARLKEYGFNAWRTSHNPVNPELLDAMDAQGMLALVELRTFSNSSQAVQDAVDMVLRDRNHASSIGYSLCNEGGCASWGTADALAEARQTGALLKGRMMEADASRPVTAAVRQDGVPATDSPWLQGVVGVVDIMGINYSPFLAATWTQLRPFQPVVGTEQGSCQSDRSILAANFSAGYVGEDFNVDCSATNGAAVAQGEFYMGSFLWSGFDYRGEPNPTSWPTISSHFGAFDSAGFPKANAAYYANQWAGSSAVTIFPHWTRPAADAGLQVPLHVYAPAAAASIQLLVNGVPAGTQPLPALGYATFTVAYAPGNVSALALDAAGALVGSGMAATAGAPAQLALSVDAGAQGVYADGVDVALLAVAVLDAAGRLVPAGAVNVSFGVAGGGHVMGVGNGDPASHEADKGVGWRSSFGGLVRLLVRANVGGAGGQQLTVTANAPGLAPAALNITVLAPAPPGQTPHRALWPA